MQYADLHIHSKYSRATSKDLDFENLCLWGAKKGLSLISTGDFTHPKWFDEIKEKLIYLGDGTFKLKDEIEKSVLKDYPKLSPPRFVLSVEISTIYKKWDKTRKVHHVVFCPDIKSAQTFREKLDSIGNINSDGRPILGLNSRNLLEIALSSSSDSFIIPAHIWTPWFSVLGSKSGFDSIEDCYEDLSDYIFALETGLSSDPYMNWRVSKLDKYRLVSNSDAHSPSKLAREATVFDIDLNYSTLKNALKTGEGYFATVEFFPEEGKYHIDGHRKCGVCFDALQTKKLNGICPICKKPLTIGVSYRVNELADRFGDFVPPKTAGKVYSLVPLAEIISEIFSLGTASKKVAFEYERLILKFGSELDILQNVDLDLIGKDSPILKEALFRLRNGNVIKKAGYDGEYGSIKLFKEGEAKNFYNLKLDIKQLPNETKTREKVYEAPELQKNEENYSIEKDLIQEEIIKNSAQRILITAGPGSGKTTVLTKRIAYLINEKKADSKKILAITFTKKACSEMKQRLEKLAFDKEINIHTFHSLCFNILKEKANYAGLKDDFRIICEDEKKFLGDNIQNSLTFDDLILYTLKLFENNPDIKKEYQDRFKYIFIDEYQDIDENQYKLIKYLTLNDTNIFAIGDKNQAIYGFRGGSARFFNNFTLDYKDAKVITLKNNYRSSKNIVDASNKIINSYDMSAKNPLKCDKITLYRAKSEKEEAEYIISMIENIIGGKSFFSMDSNRVSDPENKENYSFSDFAIFFRSKSFLAPVKEALERSSMPYCIYSNSKLIELEPIKRLLFKLDDETDVSFQLKKFEDEFLDIPKYVYSYLLELSEKSLNKANFIHEVSLSCLSDTYDKNADRISLMSLHASKGLEFPCVFIFGAEEGIIPSRYTQNEQETEEEKRLLYVGITRAKNQAYITYCKKRLVNSTIKERQRSRFLDVLDSETCNFKEAKENKNIEKARQLSLFKL